MSDIAIEDLGNLKNIDVKTSVMNFEEESLDDVVDNIKNALDDLIETVGEDSVVPRTMRCSFNPLGDGDFHFWIGCQVR